MLSATDGRLGPRVSVASSLIGDVPLLRKEFIAKEADELPVADDVELATGRAAAKHDDTREPGRVSQTGALQSIGYRRPGVEVRAISCRLVADLYDIPSFGLALEANLSGGEYRFATCTSNVLATAWSKP